MAKKTKSKKIIKQPEILDKRKQTAERIEAFMGNLPSSALLASVLAKHQETIPLILKFLETKERAKYLGTCLKASFGGGGGSPLLRDKYANKITESEYRIFSALVTWYNSVFDLVQSNWEYIEQDLKWIDHPSDEINFFFEILREDFDGRYEHCISGYRSSVRDIENFAIKVRGACWRTPSGEAWADKSALSDLSEFSNDLPSHDGIWFGLVLTICNKYAQSDAVVWDKLSGLRNQIAALADLVATQTRKERSIDPPGVYATEKWKDGNLYRRTKNGWELVTELNIFLSFLRWSILNKES